MKQRITWTRREGLGQSGWNGIVGRKRLFTIESSITRGEGWKLGTRLPMNPVPNVLTNHDGEALKAVAERLLEHFVKSLGAEFTHTEKEQQ